MAADFLPPGQPSTGPVFSPTAAGGSLLSCQHGPAGCHSHGPSLWGQRTRGWGPGESFSVWACGLFPAQGQHSREWGVSGRGEGTAYAKAQEVGVLAAVRGLSGVPKLSQWRAVAGAAVGDGVLALGGGVQVPR